MKRILVLLALIASPCWAGEMTLPINDDSLKADYEFVQPFLRFETPKEISILQTPNPKFLLALRYMGTVQKNDGDIVHFERDWIYLYEVYQTKSEVLARLQQPCGWDSSSIVGCWSLTDDRKVNIVYKEVPHEAERKVVKETQKWIEKVWEVK